MSVHGVYLQAPNKPGWFIPFYQRLGVDYVDSPPHAIEGLDLPLTPPLVGDFTHRSLGIEFWAEDARIDTGRTYGSGPLTSLSVPSP